MTLALYGHPFSSYTWKALIALYANSTPFEFRMLGEDHPEHGAFVAGAGPSGQFPVLRDGDQTIFEATVIIEHLDLYHRGAERFLPDDSGAAIQVRMWDRVLDLHVMNVMQQAVAAKLKNPQMKPEAARDLVRDHLLRVYAWIEAWLAGYTQRKRITLIECAAAPSLFYADWVIEIPATCPRLHDWRAHLLALPPVARCIEEARLFRPYFPLGAPDRD